MKRFLFVAFCVTAFLTGLRAQVNLVPNPSFETYDTCPTAAFQINYAQGWSSNRGTPDYFNSCTSSIYSVGIPYNIGGYQYTHSGNAYAGFVAHCINSTELREQVGVRLSDTLTVGVRYYVSFYVSLSVIDSSLGQTYAVDKIGTKFSSVSYDFNSPIGINNFSHVYTDTIITDTLGWTLIFGSFIADSAYVFLSVGNFFDNASTDQIAFYNDTTYQGAYYYVDDVCVSSDSIFAATWTSVRLTGENQATSFYPNPTVSLFTIDVADDQELYSAEVIDVQGNSIASFINVTGDTEVDLSTQSSGLYLIMITTKNKRTLYKLLKL